MLRRKSCNHVSKLFGEVAIRFCLAKFLDISLCLILGELDIEERKMINKLVEFLCIFMLLSIDQW